MAHLKIALVKTEKLLFVENSILFFK